VVFLEAAVGIVRVGAGDEVGGEGWVEIIAAEGGAVGEAEALHDFGGAEGGVAEAVEKGFDLVGDLVG
jgi:hypothetical protein